MKIDTKNLAFFFGNSPNFRLIHQAITPDNTKKTEYIAGHLSLVHPYKLQLIEKHELNYLNTLSQHKLSALITQLSSQGTLCLVFDSTCDIPKIFFQQNSLHLAISQPCKNNLQQTLLSELHLHFSERITKHGGFVVVHGRGMLITGNSGEGKSSLLLNLVKQGHLWVADDISLFYLNHQKTVIGHAEKNLSEYIHVKGIGPINMDKNYGQASRIPTHPLDAIIHLSNNINHENLNISAYSQQDSATLFDINFPMWHFSSAHPNLGLMIEHCAKNLILRDWGYHTANALDKAVTESITP